MLAPTRYLRMADRGELVTYPGRVTLERIAEALEAMGEENE